MKVAFSVDDLSPLYDFDCLDLLHDTLGLKFDAFIPTNHFGEAYLPQMETWTRMLHDRSSWIQVNIHGIEHRDKNGCSIEYKDLNYEEFITSISDSINTFRLCGFKPYGIKAPGWDVNHMDDYLKASKDLGLSYVCLHRPGETLKYQDINDIKTFGYTVCVHEDFNITNDSILHSHIHPSQGRNGLTNELVNHILRIMMPIVDQIEPVFLKDCL